MARIEIKDCTEEFLKEVDKQRAEIGINNRADYIRLLINLDIMHKITIQVHKNQKAEKELQEALNKINALQDQQIVSLERAGESNTTISRLRKANANNQDYIKELNEKIQELKDEVKFFKDRK